LPWIRSSRRAGDGEPRLRKQGKNKRNSSVTILNEAKRSALRIVARHLSARLVAPLGLLVKRKDSAFRIIRSYLPHYRTRLMLQACVTPGWSAIRIYFSVNRTREDGLQYAGKGTVRAFRCAKISQCSVRPIRSVLENAAGSRIGFAPGSSPSRRQASLDYTAVNSIEAAGALRTGE
jgi:hypothetical protein